jgi:hypothetical protein
VLGEGKGKNMTLTARIILATPLVALTLAARAADTDRLISHLESVPSAEASVYQLKDSNGARMDCLKVFQGVGDEYAGVYYGVYHNLTNSVLVAHLARSTDLLNWTHVTALDTHASQPTIRACDGGAYVLAYEKDAPDSVWIRMRFYKNLQDLLRGQFQKQFDIPRTLAPTAEGTPSFESVQLSDNGIDTSEIQIRFHYYKNRDVDQLARGTLKDFKAWEAEPLAEINSELRNKGWLGNLGDRDRLMWQGRAYYLQEIQQARGDWSSWRLCLCDDKGMPIRTLSIRTHKGSTAFSNPSATWITDSQKQRKLVVTLFLLSEGNPSAEVGTLLYAVNPSKVASAEQGSEGDAVTRAP